MLRSQARANAKPERTPIKAVNAFADGDQLVILSRDESGRLKTSTAPAEHVCFLRASDVTKGMHRELSNSPAVKSVKLDGEFFRIGWRDPDTLKRLVGRGGLFEAREMQTYEGDVDPVRRWLTDNPVQVQRPRRCYLDLESDSRVSFQKKFEARMLCWSVIDHDTGETTSMLLEEDTDEAEARLLLALWTALERFDQVIAWAGDWFDFPYLVERSSRRRLSVDPRRWLWLDHMILFRRMNTTSSESGEEKQSMSLDAVARIIVGRGKLEFEDEDELEELLAEEEEKPKQTLGAQSWDLWVAGGERRKKLELYCRNDTQLMHDIEGKTGYIELLFTVCEVCSTFPDTRGINPTQQVDGFLLRLSQERGMRAKTRRFAENTEQFKGAFNLDPVVGLHTDEIHVCDFAGMYPSIIISFNMSPETYRPDIVLKEDVTFRSSYYQHLPPWTKPLPAGHCQAAITDKVFALEPRGILPDALIRVRKLREFWTEEEKQHPPGTPLWQEAHRRAIAYKVIANCFYGVVSSPFSRFFERAVGESTAQTGVWLIQAAAKAATDRGWLVIYIDTDALYVKGCTRDEFGGFVAWCNGELFPRMLKERGCTENLVKLDYEKALARMVIVAKKRYIAMYAHYKGKPATAETKPEIKGLEFKRGDSLKLTRKLQQAVAYRLLGYQCEASSEPSDFETFLEEYARTVFDSQLALDDVKQSQKLAKPIGDYVRKPKNVPAMNKLQGEDVSMLFSEFECASCGATPSGMLSVRAGVCEIEDCGGKLKKKRNSINGTVVRYMGDRVAVSNGRRTQLVLTDTIDSITCFSSLPKHVGVARTLAARGQNVSAGVRIEYVTIDSDDPFGTVPVADWNGEVDRHHLWKQVFEPTARLLEAAFPRHPWGKHRRVKPQVFTTPTGERLSIARKAPKAKPKKSDNQGSLF